MMYGLPLNGAFARSMDPDRLGRGWGTNEELLAIIAELVDSNTRMFLAAHVPRGTNLPKPIYIQRPDDYRRRPTKASPQQTKQLMKARGIPIVHAKKKKGGE